MNNSYIYPKDLRWCKCGHKGSQHFWMVNNKTQYSCLALKCNCRRFQETSKLQAKINRAIK